MTFKFVRRKHQTTLKEFLLELKSARYWCCWFLDDNGLLRAGGGFCSHQYCKFKWRHITGSKSKYWNCFAYLVCPIIAVAEHRGIRDICTDDATEDAAVRIGLGSRVAEAIIVASNNQDEFLTPFRRKVRKQLLRVVGLREIDICNY